MEEVEKFYDEPYMIQEGFGTFQDELDTLGKMSTQYLLKWVASCRLVMKKEKDNDGVQTKGRTKRKRKVSNKGSGTRDCKQVDPYSSSHGNWSTMNVGERTEITQVSGAEAQLGDQV